MTRPKIPRPCEWVVRVLLLGWGAPTGVPIGRPIPPADQREMAALFAAGSPGLAALWRKHRPWLLAEGKRLRVPPLCSRGSTPVYFGDYIAGRLPATGRQR